MTLYSRLHQPLFNHEILLSFQLRITEEDGPWTFTCAWNLETLIRVATHCCPHSPLNLETVVPVNPLIFNTTPKTIMDDIFGELMLFVNGITL